MLGAHLEAGNFPSFLESGRRVGADVLGGFWLMDVHLVWEDARMHRGRAPTGTERMRFGTAAGNPATRRATRCAGNAAGPHSCRFLLRMGRRGRHPTYSRGPTHPWLRDRESALALSRANPRAGGARGERPLLSSSQRPMRAARPRGTQGRSAPGSSTRSGSEGISSERQDAPQDSRQKEDPA